MGDSDAGKNRPISGSIRNDGRDVTTLPRPCRNACGRDAVPHYRKQQDLCKPCYNAVTAEMANATYQRNYRICCDLMGGRCIDCGEPDQPKKKLHFAYWAEHPSGDQRPMGRFMMHATETLLERVKWCDLVCHSCHGRRRYRGVPNSDRHQVRREKTQLLVDCLLAYGPARQ